MSFTAEVKDELSRVRRADMPAALAELSALMRVCGTFSFHGPGRYSLRVATETGSVARTVLGLIHKNLDLQTALTVRRSVQRKSNNYLIEVPDQPGLASTLVDLGILAPSGGLVLGVPEVLVGEREQACAFVRGAFMGGGFIADPRGDLHMEVAVSTQELALGVQDLMRGMGVPARINHRRGTHAVYLKSFDGVRQVLWEMGACESARATDAMRRIKSVKNEVNRKVNAELANGRRSSRSGAEQLHLIGRVAEAVGIANLPPALREFCELRVRHPEMSLADLGKLCDPPASKSAMYHRVLRLQELV